MGCSQGQSARDAPEIPTARDGSPSAGLLNPSAPSCSPSLRPPRPRRWAGGIRGKFGQRGQCGAGAGAGRAMGTRGQSCSCPPAVTHWALIAPCSGGLLAAPHQRCHVIVMREELMVKGDTTNKTSSGKLSLTGRIKGQGSGCPAAAAEAGTGSARHRGGSGGSIQWPENHPATAGPLRAGAGFRDITP